MRRQVACYLSAACIATLMSLPGSAQALLVPIPGLFGTGLDDDGNVQANGAKEKQYAFHGNGSVPHASPHSALMTSWGEWVG
jgi:hypothetical protein